MANEGLFYKFLLWREKRIKEKHFILIISFIVGLCTAAAAIILKQLIHFIQHLLTGNFNADGVNYLYLLYPVIGILLAGLFVKYILSSTISKPCSLANSSAPAPLSMTCGDFVFTA